MRIFKYPLRINIEKYPEVYEALKQAQRKDGIAFYIRKLVECDIAMRKNGVELPVRAIEEIAITKQHEPPENNSFAMQQSNNFAEEKESSVLNEEDFGGGLA